MSTTPQSRKGLTSRQKFCSKVKHKDEVSAKVHIEKLRKNGTRGTARLKIYRCTPCTKRAGKNVFHVGHRRPE